MFVKWLSNKLQSEVNKDFSEADRKTMDTLASISYQAYQDFKGHPKFIPYLERISTLKYYGKANIGSRPSKRSKSEALIFSDLRAIPFLGSWSQLKQNVPGFFGVGSAIQAYESRGELDKVIALYNNSSFFSNYYSYFCGFYGKSSKKTNCSVSKKTSWK